MLQYCVYYKELKIYSNRRALIWHYSSSRQPCPTDCMRCMTQFRVSLLPVRYQFIQSRVTVITSSVSVDQPSVAAVWICSCRLSFRSDDFLYTLLCSLIDLGWLVSSRLFFFPRSFVHFIIFIQFTKLETDIRCRCSVCACPALCIPREKCSLLFTLFSLASTTIGSMYSIYKDIYGYKQYNRKWTLIPLSPHYWPEIDGKWTGGIFCLISVRIFMVISSGRSVRLF